MRAKLIIFLTLIFVLRGFAGQAMAVDMLYAGTHQAQAAHRHCQDAAAMQDPTESGKKSDSHGDCSLCCVVAAVAAPPKTLPTMQPETLVVIHPARFISNIPQPAFKPPVL